jgi:hypothetical protein
MAKDQAKIVAELIEARAEGWRPTIAFFEWASRQPRDTKETVVDDLQSALKISRTEMYELVRGIIEAEIGDRTIGRHRAKSRIHWRYALPDIDRCSKGKSSTLEAFETAKFSSVRKRAAIVPHVMQLRPGITIKFALPQDLTSFEAERLKKFIETCVMEDPK